MFRVRLVDGDIKTITKLQRLRFTSKEYLKTFLSYKSNFVIETYNDSPITSPGDSSQWHPRCCPSSPVVRQGDQVTRAVVFDEACPRTRLNSLVQLSNIFSAKDVV
jgi:hypothetical protein